MEGLSFGILRYSVKTLQFLIEDGISVVGLYSSNRLYQGMPSQFKAFYKIAEIVRVI